MQRFKKILSTAVTVTTISWSIGLGTLIPLIAKADNFLLTQDTQNLISVARTISGTGEVALFSFTLPLHTGAAVTGVPITITQVLGIALTNQIQLNLYTDANNNNVGDVGEANGSINAGINIPTTITPTDGSINIASKKFLITVKMQNTPSNGAIFTANIAGNGVVISGGHALTVALSSQTSSAITVDTVAPTIAGGIPDGSMIPVEALIDLNFSEAILASSVTALTLNLFKIVNNTPTGGNLCTYTVNNTQVTCIHGILEINTLYRLTATTGITDSAGNALAAQNVRNFTTGSFSGGGTITIGPMIVSSFPQPGGSIPTGGKIILNLPLGPEGDISGVTAIASVTTDANITIKLVANGIAGGNDLCDFTCPVLDNTARRIVLTPSALTVGAEYELQAQQIKNANGVAMPSPFFTRFRVAIADSTAPALRTLSPTNPANGATNVSRYTGDLVVFFSKPIDPSTITSNTIKLCDATGGAGGNGVCDAVDTRVNAFNLSLRYDQNQNAVHIGPKIALTASTTYCFEVIGGGTGVKDTSGNAIAATTVANCFTTDSANDTAGAKLLFVDADNFKLVAHFSESLNAADAIDSTKYTLQCPTGVGVDLSTKTLTYRPEFKEVEIQGLGFQPDASCTLTIASTMKDLAGNNFDGVENSAQFKVLNATLTGGFLGTMGVQDFTSSTNFAVFALAPQRCQPRTLATNKATSLECEFPVPQALTTGAKLLLTLPSGFTLNTIDGATRAVPALNSFMNQDLNGPGPGVTTITAAALDAGSGTITLTLAHTGTAMGASDMVRFELDRLTTPTIAAQDSRISIVIKDSTGIKVGQTIQAAPFTLGQAGVLEIKGAVFKDSDSDGIKDAGEGINAIKVFCNQMGGFQVGAAGAVGMMGFQEATTDVNGDYSFTGLTSGQYGCNIPPQTNLNNANVGGSSPFQNVSIADTTTDKSCAAANRSDCADFKFTDLGGAGARTLTVNITGGPAATELDAFCFAPGNFQSSAPVMKALTLDGSGAGNTTLKLQNNVSYDCGIGPHIAFESFGTGAPQVPTFSFMPPRPQQVAGGTTAAALTFALTSTNRTITGTVVDGSNAGIGNVFVHAEPVGCFNATSGVIEQCNGAFAQTKSDGTFTLNVADGVYEVGADGPGLPPSTRSTASVKGVNVTGVTLKMVKSSTTISGTVKDESGNGIKYAHVSGQRIASGGTCSSFTPAGGFADSPTDSSGNYTLYTAAGTWCVRAFAPSYGEIGNKVVVVATTSQTGQNISATAAEYGTITGTITSGGTAVTSGFINCFGSSGGNNAQIGSDGTFSLKVKAGTGYTCDGFVPGVGPITRQTSVAVTPSATTALGTIALGNAGTITVTVTGISDGFCDARSGTGIGSGAPLQSGTATIKAQAGTYTVRCGSPKTGELVNQSGVALTAGGTATVAASSTLTTRSVAGQVTDGTNNLEGVTLKFDDKTTGRSFTITTGNQSGATTDNLSATSIPEGTYKVTASKKGYEAATTTATVSGGNLDLTPGATALALTSATAVATAGEAVNIPVDAADGITDYTGNATVIATKTEGGVVKTVVGELDATAGTAPLALTNGTWTLTAIGDNGKTTASSSTITITNGAVVGATPDLDLTTNIGGKSDAQVAALLQNQSETVALSSGGLLKFKDLAVGGTSPEVNIPASALSTSDSSTGKVDMKADTTLAGIDPGIDLNFVGSSGYDITPKDASGNPITSINGTVTITMPYTDADVTAAGVEESKLQFGSFNTTSQTWETFPTTVDMTNNLLIASVSHFSSFGILGSIKTAVSSSAADSTPPAAPSNVKATSDGSKVTLTWTDPSDSDLTRIFVLRNAGGSAPISGNPYAYIDKGKGAYTDTGVTAGTTYKYILRAEDTSGNTDLNLTEVSVKVEAAAAQTPSPTPGATTPSGTTPATPATPALTTPETTPPPATPTPTEKTPAPPTAPTTTPPAAPKTAVEAAKAKVASTKTAVTEAKTALADAKVAVKEAQQGVKDANTALRAALKSKDADAIAEARAAIKEAQQGVKDAQKASVTVQKALTKVQTTYNKANAELKKAEAAAKAAAAKAAAAKKKAEAAVKKK